MAPIIEVKFDEPNAVYYGGQIVSGTVQITFTEPKTIKGILVTINGFGKAEWYGKKKKKSGQPDYTGFEEYLSQDTYLVKPDNDTSLEMPVGVHSYIFKGFLPEDLPSSFEGLYGHVRYVVAVTIERQWKANQIYTAGFTVLKTVDLDRECPQSKLPVEVENTKTYGCGLCKTSPLLLRATLPQTGYVPGQIIPVKIFMSSVGSISVTEVRIYLQKIVTYRAEKPMLSFKEDIVDLLHKTSGHLQANSQSTFDENLTVPSVPPTTLMHSKILKISYGIKMVAVLTENYEKNNLIVLCPITIGSAPSLPETSNVSSVPAVEVSLPSSSSFRKDIEAGAVEPTTSGFTLPPPSYEESIDKMPRKLHVNE